MNMKTQSLWKDLDYFECSRLTEERICDVLIVGGGITGLSVMYELRNSGLDVMLVERNISGQGVTSRSTAKVTFLQDNTIINIKNLVSDEAAKRYLKSQIEATKMLASIVEEEKINCDLKEVDSYLFTNSNVPKLKKIEKILSDNGVEVSESKEVPFDEKSKKAIKVKGTYVFHPLKYINHLKKMFKDKIFEHSKLEKIFKSENGYESIVNGHIIKSKYVVLATHYPYFLFPLGFPLKSHIEVSYLGAKKVTKSLDYSAINIDKPTISMRYHDDGTSKYLIYLYNSFMSSNIVDIKENFEKLKNRKDLDYIWSNNDIMTNDFMPYIGFIEPGLLIATGYNTWGMTNGVLSGRIIANLITSKKEEYEDLFSVDRILNLSKIVRFPVDVGASLKSYLKSGKNNPNNDSVKYTKINGVNVAIYKDEKGIEHTVLNRCPHMKCGICFNKIEKTWDCLCHGSRFDLDGKCIEGPSNFDITYKKAD